MLMSDENSTETPTAQVGGKKKTRSASSSTPKKERQSYASDLQALQARVKFAVDMLQRAKDSKSPEAKDELNSIALEYLKTEE